MPRIEIYTKDWCPFCSRAKALLDHKGVDYEEIDVTRDADTEKALIERSGGRRTVPQIFVDGRHLGGSDDLEALDARGELDAILGLEGKSRPAAAPVEHAERVVILGSGPAGLTAAIYAARANLSPVVVEGAEPGGQLTITTDVENYPGFPEGVLGPDMMQLFRRQAERFGTRFVRGNVSEVSLSKAPFRLQTDQGRLLARTLIISTGASAKKLGLPSESRLLGHGVSMCATCDGFFFKDVPVAVVGGGDTAMEEALFLTKFASRVIVVHRRDQLRASKIMQERAFRNEKMEFVWDSVVEEVVGEDKVAGVRLRNVKTGEESRLDVGGLFVAIGHQPNTALFEGQLEMEGGYIKVAEPSTATSVAGVYACGDAADPVYRQAITAAGTGCRAAIDAERWLAEQE